MRQRIAGWFARRKASRVEDAERVLENAILKLRGHEELTPGAWNALKGISASSASSPSSATASQKREAANALYQGTTSTERNESLAWKLWTEAASEGDVAAKYSVAMGVLSGTYPLSPPPLTPTTAERALEEIAALSPSVSPAQKNAAFALANLSERSGDRFRALDLYEKSGEAGHEEGCYKAGELRRNAEEHDAARVWFEKGAEQGHAECLHALSVMDTNGDGGARDPKKGFRRALEAAAASGASDPNGATAPHIAFSVGNHYYHAMGVGLDKKKAIQWWTQAANGGFVYAMVNLGTAYRDGIGVREKSLTTARSWYERAASRGSDVGGRYLEELDRKFPHVKRRGARRDG